MSHIFKNLLEPIMDLTPPYKVEIKPIGVEAIAEFDRRVGIDVKRQWFDGSLQPVSNKQIAFTRLSNERECGVLTVLRDDYIGVNMESYESIYSCFDTPQLLISALLKSNRKGLTFWNTSIEEFDTYAKLYDYLFSIIENGVYIDKILINDKMIELNGLTLTAVWGTKSAPVVTPYGRVFKSINGVFKRGAIRTYPHVSEVEIPDTGTRCIVGTNAFLPSDYDYVDPIDTCPACGGGLVASDVNAGRLCVNKDCTPIRDTFINCIAKQTEIESSTLIDQFNRGDKFHYDADCIIEKQQRREFNLDLFAIYMSMLHASDVLNVVKYLYKPSVAERCYQFSVINELINTYITEGDPDDDKYYPKLGKLPNTPKVILVGSFYNLSDHAVSLMLKRNGLELTHIVDEALFAISGNDDDEFIDYIRENTNMFILSVSSGNELSSLLK